MSVGERKPITKARSEWERSPRPLRPDAMEALIGAGAEHHGEWRRRVGDGLLMAIVTRDPVGIGGDDHGRLLWHLSVSFRDGKGRLTRYPRWDEITDARYRLDVIPVDVTMVMVLPTPDEYVAHHDTTFHLHELR